MSPPPVCVAVCGEGGVRSHKMMPLIALPGVVRHPGRVGLAVGSGRTTGLEVAGEVGGEPAVGADGEQYAVLAVGAARVLASASSPR